MSAMNSDVLLITFSAAIAVATAILGVGAIVRVPRQRALARIGLLEQNTPYVREAEVLRNRALSDIHFLDALLQGRAWVTRAQLRLARAGIELTLESAKELRAALDRAIAAAEFEEAEVRGHGAPTLVQAA